MKKKDEKKEAEEKKAQEKAEKLKERSQANISSLLRQLEIKSSKKLEKHKNIAAVKSQISFANTKSVAILQHKTEQLIRMLQQQMKHDLALDVRKIASYIKKDLPDPDKLAISDVFQKIAKDHGA